MRMRAEIERIVDPSGLVVDSRSSLGAGTTANTEACDRGGNSNTCFDERGGSVSMMPETPPTETFLADRQNSPSPGLVQCIVSALTRTPPTRHGGDDDDEEEDRHCTSSGSRGDVSSHCLALEKKRLEDELNIKMQEVFNLTAVVKQLSESRADALMARSDMCEKLSDVQREVMRMEHVVCLARSSAKEAAASLREARQENKTLRASLESVQRNEQYLMDENAELRRRLRGYENGATSKTHHSDALGMSALRLDTGY
ncbi:hypothetical protein M9435_002939 [Picochlorum sp. BPE23]|nr:hypothetical protein M9435_002939 [Picochlorum sp. BPE23]